MGYFKGNIWAGEIKFDGGFFFDERADEKQREALKMIFSGKAGGFMAAKLLGEVKFRLLIHLEVKLEQEQLEQLQHGEKL